jgi:hypothetical protein
MGIRYKCFRGRQISLLVSVQRYLEGKGLRFIAGHLNDPSNCQQNLMWVADLEEGGIGPGIQWRKVVNEYVADYSV